MARLIDADGARVVRYIGDAEAEVMGAWRRAGLVPVAPGERIALSPTWAISQVRVGGTTAVSHLSRDDAARAGAGLRMGIAAPVRADGGVWGAVAAAFREAGSVPAGATQRVERFAKLVGIAVANAEARARLIVQATTDALTGLANHTTFHSALAEAVARAERHEFPLSLALIDLDRFKTLNDTMGHRAGDTALAIVGGLLRAHARRGDVVGRIGGEELAWLMPDTDGPGGVEAADRLRRAVAAAPIQVPAGLTASFGVATRSPGDRDPDGLFHRADRALYQAKRVGRDRVVGPA
jgi:diguanylate cyclase (GGDEF)-like protein